jgi:hypothetical protein
MRMGTSYFYRKEVCSNLLKRWKIEDNNMAVVRQGALKTYLQTAYLKTCVQQGQEQMFHDCFSPWPMYGEETIQAPLQNELHALQENMNYVCAYNLFIYFCRNQIITHAISSLQLREVQKYISDPCIRKRD